MHLRKTAYQWHRKLAVLAAIPVLLWSLSGVLHPMMAHWFKPTIAKRFIPPAPIPKDAEILPPSTALIAHPKIHHFSLIRLKGNWAYLAITPDQKQHFHYAHNGKLIPDGATLYAEQLARAYLDDELSPLISIRKIESFEETYGYINRLLPVYRVKLDRADRLEVVVDLRTGRLATYDHQFRRIASLCFDWFHRWSFLGDRHSVVRILSISIVSLLSLATGVLGLLNLIFLRKRRNKGDRSTTSNLPRKLSITRRLHRVTGMVSLPFYFMFSLSGFYHVIVKLSPDTSTSWVSQQSILTSKLEAPIQSIIRDNEDTITNISLSMLEGNPYYRVSSSKGRKPQPTKLIPATSTANKTHHSDKEYAIALACEFSGYSASSVERAELITSFRKDYGFIFKRLPVWRVHFKEQEYWHYTVDTADAHMAMRMRPADLLETLSFINLHKLHLLDPIHKNLRHTISAVVTILICILIGFGLSLLRKSKGKRN